MEHFAKYENLLSNSRLSMFTHSLKYKSFLDTILSESKSIYLGAFHGSDLVAALPSFAMNGPLGTVVNSLPFYGSHGGIISKDEIEIDVVKCLIGELMRLCELWNAFSCTLIESPRRLETSGFGLADCFGADYFDSRIGQITEFPAFPDSRNLENDLLGLFHPKTRNAIRKGLKEGFDISHEDSIETLSNLQRLHSINIEQLKGSTKGVEVFEAIRSNFSYDLDYRVYVARDHGQIVSALLVFYFGDTIEYFIPASLPEHRSRQPLSALIYTAMKDAITQRGARFWNWGGTWLTQEGVYTFKSRWGATDFPYRYHTRVFRPELLRSLDPGLQSQQKLGTWYPNFYVLPYDSL